MGELDASTLQQPTPRRLTQLASRLAYRQGLDGIYYRSRYGHDLENWALFEPFRLEPVSIRKLTPEDLDLQWALRLHGLALAA